MIIKDWDTPSILYVNSLFAWNDVSDIGGLKVIITPIRGKTLKDTAINCLKEIKEEELKRIVIRAKATQNSEIMDYFILGKSKLSLPISAKSENEILSKLNENGTLSDEIESLLETLIDSFNYKQNTENEEIDNYFNCSNWDDIIGDNTLSKYKISDT